MEIFANLADKICFMTKYNCDHGLCQEYGSAVKWFFVALMCFLLYAIDVMSYAHWLIDVTNK